MSSHILTRTEAKYIWNNVDLMARVELIETTQLKKTWGSDGWSQDVNSSHSWNQIGYKNQSAVIKTLSNLPMNMGKLGKIPLKKYSDILEYNGLMKYLKHNQEQVKICKSQIKDILPKIEGYV
jgi:hypothetical protein